MSQSNGYLKKTPAMLEFAYANSLGKTDHKTSLLEYSLIVILIKGLSSSKWKICLF